MNLLHKVLFVDFCICFYQYENLLKDISLAVISSQRGSFFSDWLLQISNFGPQILNFEFLKYDLIFVIPL